VTAYEAALFWFRRDLRDRDNAGLHQAARACRRLHCVFVFDRAILDALPRRDRRVDFIHRSVLELRESLRARGGELIVLHGDARQALPRLAAQLGVDAVFANGDYEPFARARDDAVREALAGRGRALHLAKDTVVFEKDEIVSRAGKPFAVFTPYRNAWRAALDRFHVEEYPPPARDVLVPARDGATLPSLEALGFERTDLDALGVRCGMSGAAAQLERFAHGLAQYARQRDFPGRDGTSRLSVHNRFGTVSIRAAARLALSRRGAGAATWLDEIAWRDFFFQVLWHHPRVEHEAFRHEYARLAWPGGEELFAAWCEGRTGYPVVDAGMRELVATGFMHNRVRMVVASFLAKDLLLDWRRGERFFARHLLDYDLAANNGNWQWAASTGCDAQPYFRIFNPVAQSERFDAQGAYIRRHVPELARVPVRHVHAPWRMTAAEQREARCEIGRDYPAPVVDHAAQREKALALYRRSR
jgi:deoxyribodipyrimidine photo-lyase